ncbi:hypothetical protein PIB30_068865 [Stylosanthes scabra]|uniref:Uncharacterized protein n=1 Tax=Stylosanthes scabra TaxID=79078 RepID=A0ABU6VMN5_9FABA|nr:hypothetical protein [Stylosanthes scabra]
MKYIRARSPNLIHSSSFSEERKKIEAERKGGVHGGGGGVTIHPLYPASITFTPELRLTHRLRLRKALFVLFDCIPLESKAAVNRFYLQQSRFTEPFVN